MSPVRCLNSSFSAQYIIQILQLSEQKALLLDLQLLRKAF